MHLGISGHRPSWSRMALVIDRIQPTSRAEEYRAVPSRAFTFRFVLTHDDLSLKLGQRVDLALRQEEELEGRTELRETARGTSSFSAVGREQVGNRNRSETPPPGSYFPQFDYLLAKSPRIIFSRARPVPAPAGHTFPASDGCQRHNKSFTSVEHTSSKFRGIPFGKQTERPKFIDPRKGPNEKRFILLKESRGRGRKVHAFGAYSPRRELFRLPTYAPDYYSPKYDFLSKPSQPRGKSKC